VAVISLKTPLKKYGCTAKKEAFTFVELVVAMLI